MNFETAKLKALEYAALVQCELPRGRCADSVNNMANIAALSVFSKRGDYCEIGTLFGGTAITVALTRKYYGSKGNVYCIDPLDGFYTGVVDDNGRKLSLPVDPTSRIPVNRETVINNALHFGVNLTIIQKPSQPWPDEVEGHKFTVGYIDGNHWNNWPLLDFQEMSRVVSKYIIFDNNDNLHPAVKKAVKFALENGWKVHMQDNIQVTLERA